jgi:hypothetical protein
MTAPPDLVVDHSTVVSGQPLVPPYPLGAYRRCSAAHPLGAPVILSSREETMKANVGDRLVLAGTHVGDGNRVGTIIEIGHPDGTPPYRVRWPDGHETLMFPGPDARVEPPAADTA